MKKQRLAFLSLVIAFVIIATTACAGSTDKTSTGEKAKESTKGGVAKISVTIPHFGGIVTETKVHQQWEQDMLTKLGSEIEFDWSFIPYAEYAEKNNIALAANDLTDIIRVMDNKRIIPYEDQEMFVELSTHKDLMPNYLEFVSGVPYGDAKILNADGEFYGFQAGEIPRLEQGLGIYTVPAYRLDVFEKEGIAIPETLDEFIEAARALKVAYPESYPVSGVGWAGTEQNIFKTRKSIYWDGEGYTFGPDSANYKDMLVFLNSLYQEGLMDPESFTENADEHTKKALNGRNFMQVGEWFTQAINWTNNQESDAVWVNALAPTNQVYGEAWQDVMNVNEPSLGSEIMVISTKAKDPELLIRLMDLQYTDDVIRLLTWGIKDESYVLDADGNPTFVDSMKQAENPWAEGDKFGMRASASYRPGLQLCIDTKAFIDFAADDSGWIDGELAVGPWELAFPDENWPDSPMIAPTVFAPPITFTTEEAQENASIMTAVDTHIDESRIQFIKGERSLDDYDKFLEELKGLKYEEVVERYNQKAAALQE